MLSAKVRRLNEEMPMTDSTPDTVVGDRRTGDRRQADPAPYTGVERRKQARRQASDSTKPAA
jgi:hypothetical protein